MPDPIQSKLKAERIQETLKAERIQSELETARLEELLAQVPEWQVGKDGRSLRRTYRFPSPRAAALFVQLAAEIGEASGRVPRAQLRHPEVVVTVGGADGDGIAEEDFRLARRLDGRA